MKNNIYSLIVLTGLFTLVSLQSKAWVRVQKSGFGLFGYAHPLESRWSFTNDNGVKVCVAELTCNGGGFNSCKWSTPLTQCELAKATILQNPPVPQEFTDNLDNMLIYQVSALVDDNIQSGNTSGTIIYIENHLVTYNQSSAGIISFNIYEKQEAINLGIWPL